MVHIIETAIRPKLESTFIITNDIRLNEWINCITSLQRIHSYTIHSDDLIAALTYLLSFNSSIALLLFFFPPMIDIGYYNSCWMLLVAEWVISRCKNILDIFLCTRLLRGEQSSKSTFRFYENKKCVKCQASFKLWCANDGQIMWVLWQMMKIILCDIFFENLCWHLS